MESLNISKNYKAVRKIDSLDDLYSVLENSKIIYARHRIYPTAFFYSFHLKLAKKWLDNGWFYEIKKIN